MSEEEAKKALLCMFADFECNTSDLLGANTSITLCNMDSILKEAEQCITKFKSRCGDLLSEISGDSEISEID